MRPRLFLFIVCVFSLELTNTHAPIDYEPELVEVKNDLFLKIIAFFRMLFRKLPIIEQ